MLELGHRGVEFLHQLGRAAAPTVDRLLGVADDKDRATPRIAALLDDRQKDLPLGNRSILEFIEQQMVDFPSQGNGSPIVVAASIKILVMSPKRSPPASNWRRR